MMLPVKTITEHAHNLYRMSSNLRSIAYDTAYATCNYVKTLGFFILKMDTTLFQIYLKCIWPKRQECERKHTFFIS
jgi:hypothetical protein